MKKTLFIRSEKQYKKIMKAYGIEKNEDGKHVCKVYPILGDKDTMFSGLGVKNIKEVCERTELILDILDHYYDVNNHEDFE